MMNKQLSADVDNVTGSKADSTHRSILCNACHEQYRVDNIRP